MRNAAIAILCLLLPCLPFPLASQDTLSVTSSLDAELSFMDNEVLERNTFVMGFDYELHHNGFEYSLEGFYTRINNSGRHHLVGRVNGSFRYLEMQREKEDTRIAGKIYLIMIINFYPWAYLGTRIGSSLKCCQ